MAALLVNPRKRRVTRKKSTRKAPARRKRTSAVATVRTVSRRKYRRNPSARANIVSTVKEGAIGAAGAIASEFVMSKLPLPDNMKTGQMQPIVSALVSVGVGMAVTKFGKKKGIGMAMAQGGVTVALHQTMRGFVSAPLGLDNSLAYYGDDFEDMNEGMGYTSAAPTFDDDDDLSGGFFEED